MRVIACVLALLWTVAVCPVFASTFTVVNTNDSGPGSLRQAIVDSNASPGADLVAFAIPSASCSAAGVCTITLASPVGVDDSLVIDGTTQPRYGTAPANICATPSEPSYMRVEVLGPAGVKLITVTNLEACTIKGLALGGGWGINFERGTGHVVRCNHLCLSGDGSTQLGGWGVTVSGEAAGVLIGTYGDGVTDIAERNVFGGCEYGVYINANPDSWIAGNYFGFQADGVSAAPNFSNIYIRQSSTNNLVGSNLDGVSDELERNIIGHGTTGVYLLPTTNENTSNRVVGNWIGLDASGAAAGVTTGIRLDDAGVNQLIRGNRIENNLTGIVVNDVTTLSRFSMCNLIEGNSSGLSHNGSADLIFENNWWGDASGPSGVGGGSGDPVSTNGSGTVDFMPWLTAVDEPCPLVFFDEFESGSLDSWSQSVQ